MTRWLPSLFRRDESIGLAEETRAHIAERIDDLVESGVSAPEAWRQAHREFGNRTLAVEDAAPSGAGGGYGSAARRTFDLPYGH